ncbi:MULTISPECIES: hypothetical protein [Pseudomonas]|uniref:Uncharacterized protein n=1 Tax=Pseudomonas mosselii TaxID=78327 RepID=A0A5R8ZH02_9PSED|nr:hypothetical protein [Pseudomonas mosselii]TLP65049.1 hypothetical protein FEM01_02405 [Pseudomonas mosselii]
MDRKIVPLALLATLLGCSDDQQATEAGLRKAAQAWLDTQYPRCFVVGHFPAHTRDFDVDGTNQALRALAKAGVVSEKEIRRTEVPERLWQPARTDIYYAYELTDNSRTYYKADALNGQGGLCFGKAQVTQIEGFTPPQAQGGQQRTQLTYRYRIDDLPGWANDPALGAAIKGLAQASASAAKPIQATQSMLLTPAGWVSEG